MIEQIYDLFSIISGRATLTFYQYFLYTFFFLLLFDIFILSYLTIKIKIFLKFMCNMTMHNKFPLKFIQIG